MLDVINLDFDYTDAPLLQSVNFTLSAGALLHLRGVNGSGKTTLLKLLAGLLHPQRGEIRYDGRSIHENMPQYQQKICYVGHKTGVSHILTVQEAFRFELQFQDQTASLNDVLSDFHLQGFEDVPCGLLSVGQRRRVALMRLLASPASLWLLDEPLVALDHKGVNILMSCIERHLTKGGQIILTSHQNLPLKAERFKEYCL